MEERQRNEEKGKVRQFPVEQARARVLLRRQLGLQLPEPLNGPQKRRPLPQSRVTKEPLW